MRVETRQDVMSSGEIGVKYDQAAKNLWKNREILAPLLKYSVKELEEEPVESIIRMIDADSISGDVPLSDLPPSVVIQSTEQPSVTERPITYDMHFKIKNPKLSSGNMLVMMHINLEFQNNYHPADADGKSYPVIKRGIYYAAREISAQLGRITKKTNYDNIEKAISIWVVNDNVPAVLQNTATRYYIHKEDFIGKVEEPEADYDLLEVAIIRTGKHPDITKPLFDYLQAVYNADIEEIDKFTPVSDNPEIAKEVADMPGMSQVIFKDGYDSGYGSGYGSGYDSGYGNGYDSGYGSGYDSGYGSGYDIGILDLVHDGDITVERAAEKLNKTPDEIKECLKNFVESRKPKSKC